MNNFFGDLTPLKYDPEADGLAFRLLTGMQN